MATKTLTIKQTSFLDHLIDCNGDTKLAGERAGYSPTSVSNVVKSLKSEILEMAETILAQSAPKAAFKIVSIMDSDTPIPQANVRMQAAQTILDRVGLGKTDKIPEEKEALDKISSMVKNKALSLREGSSWLQYETGRYISHMGLKKIVDKHAR